MTDWRAVAVGAVAAAAYLGTLAFLPGLDRLRLTGVPLLLGTGLVAGAAAGLAADRGPETGAWHGLLAGSLAGALFAATLVYVFAANVPFGVFHGLNYVLAASAGQFPVVATHGRLVVAGLAGAGWAGIAALGLVAGRLAPLRETYHVIEE
ncbi:hypothetical protein [Halorarius halobius]|uniref:hypothetical protein n=1 Tax=Halorarius halobius TaxID=2962671 RepID=UPI0020CFE55B|nr:hypothetical protein [Halorarius halobius]